MSTPIADVRFLRGVFAGLVFATGMCVAGLVYAVAFGALSPSRNDHLLLAVNLFDGTAVIGGALCPLPSHMPNFSVAFLAVSPHDHARRHRRKLHPPGADIYPTDINPGIAHAGIGRKVTVGWGPSAFAGSRRSQGSHCCAKGEL